MKTSVVIAVVAAMILGFCPITQANHIPVVGVSMVPGYEGVVPVEGHELTYLVNDTGMSGDTRTLADTQDSNCTKYLGDGSWATGLQFDLGQNYAVGEIRIWNYVDTTSTDPNGDNMLGMHDVYITFFDEAGTYEYGGWDGVIPQSPKTPGKNSASVVINWSNLKETDTVRYVRFYAEYDYWNWSFHRYNATGLGQVRFYQKGITDCEQAIALGYRLAGDYNNDCYVNLKDLADLCSKWLNCMAPENPACSHPWIP
jgi:hypothetical protein